ncbi:MAG: hypothetical protein ABMA13_08485 [Chthoniobacteraceae bacterium]
MRPSHSQIVGLTSEVVELRNQNRNLRAEVSQLRMENTRLKLKANPRAAGKYAEELIARIVGGQLQDANAPYDLLAPNGVRIEVKFASLTRAVKGAPTMRWVWLSALGAGAKTKDYDHLILVGEDPPSGVMIFDIPRKDVDGLIGGKNGSISANANPLTARIGPARQLHRDFYVTEEELANRYQAP